MKKKIQTSKFTVGAMKTRTYWLGVYGGHYDVVILFYKKPTHVEQTNLSYGDERRNIMHDAGDHRPGLQVVEMLDEQKANNIAAGLSLGDFLHHFPGIDLSPILGKNGRPKAIEIPTCDLIQVKLTLPLDDYQRPYSPSFHVDW